ncbi:hypothetical protein CVT26_009748 [Gymnopilus dilepis]|uniref:Aminoglycoside phosphotransferase domain-containing protein n=1 Tax=Gymnopilus dilepis TaxID=231916 RepID=A0A409YIP1_9AGAR|nr:hypothetical protein CVT26_009748 [Gymnopilus dilepis]
MARDQRPVSCELNGEIIDPSNSPNVSAVRWYSVSLLEIYYPITSPFFGMQEILSMDVSSGDEEEEESEYRIRFGDQIKYIIVQGGIFDEDTRSSMPDLLAALPRLPNGDWTTARVSKAAHRDTITYQLSYRTLDRITTLWHPTKIDVQSLSVIKRHNKWVCSVTPAPASNHTFDFERAILKIARFELEIPILENETALYQIIHTKCPGLAPRFLGHVVEHERAMGFLLEFIEGRRAGVEDLEGCQKALKRLHSRRILHGDVNRFNFIVSEGGRIYLIDFANSKLDASEEEMRKEYEALHRQLAKESNSKSTLRSPTDRPV